MRTALYRHYDARGRLLYVGISLNAIIRLTQHRASDWSGDIVRVEIQTFQTKQEAEIAEKEAIKNEKPRYNKKLSVPHRVYQKILTGEEARTIRRDLGLTMSEMAPLLGYGAASRLSEIENNKRRMSAAVARLLALYRDGVRPPDWPEGK